MWKKNAPQQAEDTSLVFVCVCVRLPVIYYIYPQNMKCLAVIGLYKKMKKKRIYKDI